jgi:hypothetical protein
LIAQVLQACTFFLEQHRLADIHRQDLQQELGKEMRTQE